MSVKRPPLNYFCLKFNCNYITDAISIDITEALNAREHDIVRGLIFEAHTKKLKLDEDNRKVALKVWKKETVSNELLKKLKFELEVALSTQEDNYSEINQIITEMNWEKKVQELAVEDEYDADMDAQHEKILSDDDSKDLGHGIIDSTSSSVERKFKLKKIHVSILNYLN